MNLKHSNKKIILKHPVFNHQTDCNFTSSSWIKWKSWLLLSVSNCSEDFYRVVLYICTGPLNYRISEIA